MSKLTYRRQVEDTAYDMGVPWPTAKKIGARFARATGTPLTVAETRTTISAAATAACDRQIAALSARLQTTREPAAKAALITQLQAATTLKRRYEAAGQGENPPLTIIVQPSEKEA